VLGLSAARTCRARLKTDVISARDVSTSANSQRRF
jgi:hypothetical protein